LSVTVCPVKLAPDEAEGPLQDGSRLGSELEEKLVGLVDLVEQAA